MKKILLMLFVISFGYASANRPDSIYIKPDIKNGTSEFHIAYSIDKIHWQHLNYSLFNSDYGPWGKQKKMYYPVISYDGHEYSATFIPDIKINQIAITKTNKLSLWKPQDYPILNSSDFNEFIAKQKKKSEDNIIRIPYIDFSELISRKNSYELNTKHERENYVSLGLYLNNLVDSVSIDIKPRWDDTKKISDNLVGVFFEDISYSADGGLYAELIQNRDFEYSEKDHSGWNALTAWSIVGTGSSSQIKTISPIHKNNEHYLVLKTDNVGAKLVNTGWDGIILKKGEKYDFSLFLRGKGKIRISLVDGKKILASTILTVSKEWRRVKTILTSNNDASAAHLEIEPLQKGLIDIDFVSLFPQKTFKGRKNGLRLELANLIQDIHPRFIRFPGGCATHGNGIDNIYHWKSSIGELWERKGDFNIWHYHQTKGLGFYEYFQFCEDIGAEPLPVLSAGVPCQNSSVGGNGQQGGIPFEKDLKGKKSPYEYDGKPLTMESYLQEIIDLIEWANGDSKKSELAKKRAKSGHPKPFNLKYIGIGNEDLISEVFLERYRFLIDGIKKAHPEIVVIGTVGPFWEGSDYEYGWEEAKKQKLQLVDEHYYNTTGWFYHHRDFYDKYDRTGPKVYLGEWASKGNKVANALIEAAYMINLERNADIVQMSSYAPLFAKEKHTSWNPDLIYFNNNSVRPTPNYYVQRAFGHNSGDIYIYSDLNIDYKSKNTNKNYYSDINERVDKSVVIDSKTNDIIVKVTSLLPCSTTLKICAPLGYENKVLVDQMSSDGAPDTADKWNYTEEYEAVCDENNNVKLSMPAYSFSIIRFTKKK